MLRVFLDRLHRNYHREDLLSSDPLEFVHRHSDPWDQEAVAILSALLAYGNVKQIRRSVEEALRRMATVAPTPSEFVRAAGEGRVENPFRGYVHRFNVGKDLWILFRCLARSWSEHASLGAHFLRGLDPDAPHFGDALDSLIEDWRRFAREIDARGARGSFSYFLTAPQDGSCCKRWCMLLRWMGRKDELDIGLWGLSAQGSPLAATFPKGRFLRTEQLVMPLDTHTGRISQYLGLTDRKSLNWLAALEVTKSLKTSDPRDPVRYDFALSRLGILDLCQRRYRAEICERCELFEACRFPKRAGRVV